MADFAYKNIRPSPVNSASTEGVLERFPSLLPCVGWMQLRMGNHFVSMFFQRQSENRLLQGKSQYTCSEDKVFYSS